MIEDPRFHADDLNRHLHLPPATPSNNLRAVRDSLLRELRRDISRLINVDNISLGSRSSAHKNNRANEEEEGGKGKSVNVRPGLALGVITLQAGARGPPRVTLH